MTQTYTAQDIEVLSGLEPVRRRPGMYTDTSRPNHLVHEVVDNSVDEALSGHCSRISVSVHKDGSVEVSDDGRGMPVDIHPKEKVSGVELILTRLHAGGKFSDGAYKFSGGLHGVGVSVVNALSKNLECWVRRGGKEYNISFASGKVKSKLEVVGDVGKANTGTTVRFWPDSSYFDSPEISIPKLKHVLKAKAVLCPGLEMRLEVEKTGEKEAWLYTGGLEQYLRESLESGEWLPDEPFTGSVEGEQEGVDWAVAWRVDGGTRIEESYVNLIPTPQGGTHVNGFRLGLTEAIREFCEFRNLLPRGLKLAPEDVWDDASYVLSTKMRDPQFAGQTKERLTSREPAAFVSGIVKDQFGLWLNQHPEAGEGIAQLAIGNAQTRLKASQKVARKRVVSGPALPGKLADCTSQDPKRTEIFLVEGDSAGGSAKQARDREFQAVMPLRGKILNTWEVESGEILSSQEVHDITVAIGVDPATDDIAGAALPQDLHPRGRRLGRRAHRDAALRAVPAAFPAAGAGGARLRRDAAAVPHRLRQAGRLCARRCRAQRRAGPHPCREPACEDRRDAFQGPRRDECAAVARNDDGARNAPAGPAHRHRRRPGRPVDGHDAREEAGVRPPRVARDQGQPGCRAALSGQEIP